jgi:Tfp pilus assembly protein PilO
MRRAKLTLQIWWHQLDAVQRLTAVLATVAFVLLVGVTVLSTWRAEMRAERQRHERAASHHLQRGPLPQAVPSAVERNMAAYAAFRRMLCAPESLDSSLQNVFAAALTRGLQLKRGRYEFLPGQATAFRAYRIELPIVGEYVAIRAFASDVLLALPFAALESIRVERGSVEDGSVTAELKFVLYLDHQRQPEPVRLASSARNDR